MTSGQEAPGSTSPSSADGGWFGVFLYLSIRECCRISAVVFAELFHLGTKVHYGASSKELEPLQSDEWWSIAVTTSRKSKKKCHKAASDSDTIPCN